MFEFYSELFISRSLRWCIGNWEWAKFVCYYFFRTRCFPGSYSEFSLYIFSAYNNSSLLLLIYIRTRVLLYRSKERKFFKDGNGFRLISLLCLRNYSNYQWQKIRRCNRKLKSDGSFRPLFDLDTCSRDFFSHILLFFFFSPFIISIKFFLIFIKYIMSIIDQRGTKMTSYTHLLGACNTLEHYII